MILLFLSSLLLCVRGTGSGCFTGLLVMELMVLGLLGQHLYPLSHLSGYLICLFETGSSLVAHVDREVYVAQLVALWIKDLSASVSQELVL